MTATPTLNSFRSDVQRTIDDFVAYQRPILADISPDTLVLIDSLSGLLSGGKRLRAAFAMWGYLAAGGKDISTMTKAASSLEFLQACALIHDDVMDASETRRGKPAVHIQFTRQHADQNWSGNSEQYGNGTAILVGDLALSWADELLLTSGLTTDEVTRAKSVYDIMRTELMAGQYLDLLEQQRKNADEHAIRRVIRFKSAKYTIERPLLMGAAIAGASESVLHQLSTYGLALGEAFQLRDDVLGVFGDAAVTGKPVGDDLREGKHTLLILSALQRVSSEDTEFINSCFGKADITADQINKIQQLITTSGALDHIEQCISDLTDEALQAINVIDMSTDARATLTELALVSTQRSA